jgi:cobalt/nickel transport system ATP-binding protein
MPGLLELEKLSYAYPGDGRQVLREVDFRLDPGGRYGLIGPNGGGKTTLLGCMVGLIKPDSGRVLFRGREMGSEKDFKELRKDVGLLFQNADDQLFSPTVLEDVAFGPLNLGMDKEEARQTAEKTLERLGLAGYGERITHKLSGGEKRLVSLATVLVMRPAALLLDEPTTGLDPETRQRLLSILSDLDTALLIVSHDLEFLSRCTDRVYAMREGRLAEADRAVLHEHVHAHDHGDLPHSHGA